jgi:hypothetical protein
VISVQAAISRIRRDLTIGALLRGALISSAAACVLLPVLGPRFNGTALLVIIGALWIVLGYRSMKGSRLAADSPFLIAMGRFDEAESRIDAAMRSFSLFKAGKLMSLHHLALLRNAQRRWQESALLCRELLGQRMGSLVGLSKPSLLLLADDLLHLSDLRGTYETLGRLYSQRLNLSEALTLQQLQLEYLACIGAYEPMIGQMSTKLQMAELMPAQHAARTQAFLALAAMKTAREGLAQWLKRRVELLANPADLVADRPILAELWPAAIPPAPAAGQTV